MDQFWLLLGFSEQLGTLNRFVVAEILVIGGGFYSRLNSKLGMIIPVVEMEAPVIDDLILRLCVRMMWSGYKSRTCGLVIYLREDTFGLYSHVVVYVLDDDGVGLMCLNSYTLYAKNGYEICWRICPADSLALCGMDKFWLLLGFSEQLGT
ncbi:hypothetical protein F2Q70_00031438 [Brassica cretica]|uniref:Uncharacterized protein n=1 Tax=Brassica cretica TaxID=69181 RepID=A0A8S9FLG4_BRACR|nr:hypothetical protein F2Q70_00031438 [Brassica cretica]